MDRGVRSLLLIHSHVARNMPRGWGVWDEEYEAVSRRLVRAFPRVDVRE